MLLFRFVPPVGKAANHPLEFQMLRYQVRHELCHLTVCQTFGPVAGSSQDVPARTGHHQAGGTATEILPPEEPEQAGSGAMVTGIRDPAADSLTVFSPGFDLQGGLQ